MTLEELCARLAAKRQELGLSIEEVVEKTKLYPSVIRDIEAGSIDNINSAYRKGFIKIYASFLNINVEDSLEHISVFDTKINKTFQSPKVKQPSLEKKIKLSIKIPPHIKRLIVIILVALCIVWLGLNFIRLVGKKIKELPKPKHSAVKRETVRPKISPPSQLNPRELSVSLTAKRECMITVKVDGKSLFHGPFKKGDRETWTGYKEINLKISDGSSVYIEVNGKPLPSLTTTHKAIKSLKVTPSGVSVDK
ncbi:MAG: RodZ domain-containing protein [Candidatus Omnitrophota bacterium]